MKRPKYELVTLSDTKSFAPGDIVHFALTGDGSQPLYKVIVNSTFYDILVFKRVGWAERLWLKAKKFFG